MYGLVLAGGGGKGGYHIGVWKALRKMKIEIGAVTGTSVGSLNGALVAQNDYKKAVKLWSNISFDQVIQLDKAAYQALLELNKKITPSGLVQAFKNSEEILEKGGVDVTPLKHLIEKHLDEKVLRKSSIAYGLVTISLTDKKPMELFAEDIPEGKLVDYLLASSFLPGFMPMELDGKRFLDGGLYDNLPINLMLKTHVEKIIAVDLKSIGRKKMIKNTDIEVIHITPSGEIAKLLEFDASQSKRDMEMGYLDTLKVFGKLGGHHYFMTKIPDSVKIIDFLKTIPLKDLEGLFNAVKLSVPVTKRTLFEYLIPTLADLFDCEKHATYQNIFCKVVEFLADYYLIERLEIYTFSDLLHKVLICMNSNDHIETKTTSNPISTIKERLGIGVPIFDVAKLLLETYEKQ